MSKKACKKKKYIELNKPKYKCKKCDLMVKKEDHVCKPKKIKDK